jgi:hypothetical protein
MLKLLSLAEKRWKSCNFSFLLVGFVLEMIRLFPLTFSDWKVCDSVCGSECGERERERVDIGFSFLCWSFIAFLLVMFGAFDWLIWVFLMWSCSIYFVLLTVLRDWKLISVWIWLEFSQGNLYHRNWNSGNMILQKPTLTAIEMKHKHDLQCFGRWESQKLRRTKKWCH